jgi:hypothetical protein
MKVNEIARPKRAHAMLGCGKTKFSQDYEYHEGGEKTVPGTDIPRVKPFKLGPRNKGFIIAEIGDLVDALAALRDPVPAGAPRTTIPRSHELLERRKQLRAQLAADPEPEIRARLEEDVPAGAPRVPLGPPERPRRKSHSS